MGVRGRATAGVLAIAALALGVSTAGADPGDRDTSFGGGNGFVNVNFAALIPNAIRSGDFGAAVAVLIRPRHRRLPSRLRRTDPERHRQL